MNTGVILDTPVHGLHARLMFLLTAVNTGCEHG